MGQYILPQDQFQYYCDDPVTIQIQNYNSGMGVKDIGSTNLTGLSTNFDPGTGEFEITITSIGNPKSYGIVRVEVDDNGDKTEYEVYLLDCCLEGLNPDIIYVEEDVSARKPSGTFSSETVLVLDKLTLDKNTTILNSTFYFGADASIDMQTTSFDITNSTLTPGCDYRWDGIFATGSTKTIEVDNSTIEGMGRGIQLSSNVAFISKGSDYLNNIRCVTATSYTAATSPLTFDDNLFEENSTAFSFAPSSISVPALTSCSITCIINIDLDDCKRIDIGSAAFTENVFQSSIGEDVRGIRAVDVETLNIKNNEFEDLTYGAYLDNTTVKVGGGTSAHGNTFLTNVTAIYSNEGIHIINNNTFSASKIEIEEPVVGSYLGTISVDMNDNTHSNTADVEIHCATASILDVRIDGNTYTNSRLALTNISTGGPNYGVYITGNTMGWNTIPGTNPYSLYLEDCALARVGGNDFNLAVGGSPGYPRATGIELVGDVSYAEIKDNYFYKCSPAGIKGTEPNGDFEGTVFYCNTFEECYNGLEFDDATLSNQGDATHGAGNQWISCTNYNYEITNPVSSNTNYYYRNVTSENPSISPGYNNANSDWDHVTSGGIVSNCSVLNKTDGANSKPVFSDLKIFPNPSNGQFTVSSSDNPITQIEVFSMNGKLIYMSKCGKLEHTIKMGNMPSGVYFIKVSRSDNTEVHKVIKL